MPYPKEKLRWSDISILLLVFFIILVFIIAIINLIFIGSDVKNNKLNDLQWSGYSPIAVYQIYDKDTGVYYVITETGGICPMYTIDGEVKLVDQGNEYVVHKNLGEPDAQK